jgi:hypothetical protein
MGQYNYNYNYPSLTSKNRVMGRYNFNYNYQSLISKNRVMDRHNYNYNYSSLISIKEREGGGGYEAREELFVNWIFWQLVTWPPWWDPCALPNPTHEVTWGGVG